MIFETKFLNATFWIRSKNRRHVSFLLPIIPLWPWYIQDAQKMSIRSKAKIHLLFQKINLYIQNFIHPTLSNKNLPWKPIVLRKYVCFQTALIRSPVDYKDWFLHKFNENSLFRSAPICPPLGRQNLKFRASVVY